MLERLRNIREKKETGEGKGDYGLSDGTKTDNN
jgi:hypothetical protein